MQSYKPEELQALRRQCMEYATTRYNALLADKKEFDDGAERLEYNRLVTTRRFLEYDSQCNINQSDNFKDEIALRMKMLCEEERKYNARRAEYLRDCVRWTLEERNNLLYSPFARLPLLGDRFQLKLILGRGKNAEVWLAHDTTNRTDIALKISDKEKHITQEHSVCHKLQHTNILQALDTLQSCIYKSVQYFCFPMKLMHCDLQHYLKSFGPMNECSGRYVMFQLLQAVEFIHNSTQLSHCEINVNNILMGPNNLQVFLTDFDSVQPKASSVSNLYHRVIEEHTPPEYVQAIYKDATYEKVDIWCLGMVFYQIFYNMHPFHLDTTKQIMSKEMKLNSFDNSTIKFPENIQVSQGAKNIIRMCLDADNSSRPSVARILQDSYFIGP